MQRVEVECSENLLRCMLQDYPKKIIDRLNKNPKWTIEKKNNFLLQEKKDIFKALRIASDFLELTTTCGKRKKNFNRLGVTIIDFYKYILEILAESISKDQNKESLKALDQLSICANFIQIMSQDLLNFRSYNSSETAIFMESSFPLSHDDLIHLLKYRFYLFSLFSQLMLQFSREDDFENLLQIIKILEQRLEITLQYADATIFSTESKSKKTTLFDLQLNFFRSFEFSVTCFLLDEVIEKRESHLKEATRKIACTYLYKLIKDKMNSKQISLTNWNKYVFYNIAFQFFECNKSLECFTLIQDLTTFSFFLGTGNENYLPEESPNITCHQLHCKYQYLLEVLRTLERTLSTFLEGKGKNNNSFLKPSTKDSQDPNLFTNKYFTELHILENTRRLLMLFEEINILAKT